MLATEIKNNAVIFTGHSIGGSLASLVALHFLSSSSCSSYPAPSSLLCITFGSPLLGNEALSKAVLRERWCGNFCHVVTQHDVVPRLLFCPLNLIHPQLVTNLLQSWQILLRYPQLARPTSVLSDEEKEQLHLVISMHIYAAAIEQQISAADQQRSPYRPFGNYALCSMEGIACFDDPLTVVRMLYSTFMTGSASSSIEEEHISYGDVVAKISENLLLKKRIAIEEEVPKSNFFAGISLALEALGIGIRVVHYSNLLTIFSSHFLLGTAIMLSYIQMANCSMQELLASFSSNLMKYLLSVQNQPSHKHFTSIASMKGRRE